MIPSVSSTLETIPMFALHWRCETFCSFGIDEAFVCKGIDEGVVRLGMDEVVVCFEQDELRLDRCPGEALVPKNMWVGRTRRTA